MPVIFCYLKGRNVSLIRRLRLYVLCLSLNEAIVPLIISSHYIPFLYFKGLMVEFIVFVIKALKTFTFWPECSG